MDRSPSRATLPTRLLGVGLAALAMAVFANALGNGFALDDVALLVDDERFHGVGRAWDALFEPYWYFPGISASLYRPVTQALLAIQWDLWGGEPLGFHAVNLVLHGTVTLLVFTLLLRLRAGRWAAAAGAAVFAVHPVHVEAVANVVGQSTLLASVFSLTACLLFLSERPGRWTRAVGVALLYLLGLGAKEIAVTLPGVLLLLAAFGAGARFRDPATDVRTVWKRLVRDLPVYALCTVTLALFLAVRLRVQGGLLETMVEPTLVYESASTRVATSLRVWPEYVRLLLFPRELVADYSPGVLFPATLGDPIAWVGAGLGAGLLVLGAVLWRRGSLAAPGIFWVALVVLPVSNLLFPIGVLLAERTLYLPSVGLALVVAGVAGAVAERLRDAPGGDGGHGELGGGGIGRGEVVAGAVLGLLLAGWLGWAAQRTWTRTPVWASTRTVLDDLVERHPESWRAQAYVADRLLSQGRRREALALFESAMELAPGHPRVMLTYAEELHEAGRYAEAEAVLRETVVLVPGAHSVQALLASSLLAQGKPREALEALDRALEYRPDDPLFHRLRAYGHARLGRWDSARVAVERSLEISGDEAEWDAYRQLAAVLLHLCREPEAEAALERARSRAPEAALGGLTLDVLREEAGGDPCASGSVPPAGGARRTPPNGASGTGPPGSDGSP